MPPPDEAAADAYLGDGYFPTWCADVVHRQLVRAASDPRYAYGETILTVWPPPADFVSLNAVTRIIHYKDDTGAPRTATVPMPIFHSLNLLSDMGNDYWPLPEQRIDGHIVTGFASRDDRGIVRILLYSHDPQDTQSRSDANFQVALALDGLSWPGSASVTEYRIDREHNSPFRLIKSLGNAPYSATQIAKIRETCQCYPTSHRQQPRDQGGTLKLSADLASNGCNYLVISPTQ
jgi:hypothetical protein